MRRLLFLLLCAASGTVGAVDAAVAQSSQLSVSGLGIPGRGESARSRAMGGSFAVFDGESSVNPAALVSIGPMTALLTGVQDFRHVENPAGDASTHGARFPAFALAGGLRRIPLTLAVNYSNYTTRDFTFGLIDTVTLRDAPVEVGDTFVSRGGLSDLRLGAGYQFGKRWAAGVGFHILTGSNRVQTIRTFADSAYLPTRQRAELGYSGFGVSVGLMGQLGSTMAISAVARTDGHLDVTNNLVDAGKVDLPSSIGGGLRWRPSPKFDIGGQVLARSWSSANEDLLAQGEAGAKSTLEWSVGGEFLPDPRRPYRRPLRFGFRAASLPFLINSTTEQPQEYGVSFGSGVRFAAQRAGIDVGLEHLWRSAGDDFSEQAWVLTIGVSVRP